MDSVLVIDFGGQYCHLIARRIRDLGVYSEILPYDTSIEKLKQKNPKAIILSGGPNSVYEKDSPQLSKDFFEYIFKVKIPVLGICYGHHLIIYQLQGKIDSHKHKEYGKTKIEIVKKNRLFEGLDKEEIVWMSHGDQVKQMPNGFEIMAKTKSCPIAAYGNEEKQIYGVQFHPEVNHTPKGDIILENFIRISNASQEWKLGNWIKQSISDIRKLVGENNRVILGLSGGVDSSVTAMLVHTAIGDRLHSIFVNNGVLRKDEDLEVKKIFKDNLGFKNFHYIDAEKLFLERLKNITDPEEKRKIIGHSFIEVFEKKTIELEKKHPDIKFLAQGTIYPDRVETAATSKSAAKIKSHHNLTLPDNMTLKIIEPLKDLYKDEVRKIGLKLGLPRSLVYRHPFPGPGLAVRIIGAIDKERLDILREADSILLEEIQKSGDYEDLWQVFCVFLPVKSVGVMGDFRTYEYICAIRAVQSRDAMTANFAKLNWDLLEKVSTRIINEVKGINRVVYDISNKPPSTIEFE
ncbi:MAG: glutamine-hydrolyzing GMP synthase [Candidatus Lokiarchaeota archaeon]|nr:glutamine-hydrolyzing GMP synthase [Candidatus Lokiarchaeota archaeon]MBD3337863.1 glutamine-hydrolyzing GMP synthase [Candidatus Lokiarchaeota archaeon]